MENIEMQVTTIEQLKKIAKGQVVCLPGFADDVPFVVRLIRPSLLDLVSDGSIPNPLIKTASKLFMKGTKSIDEESVPDMKGFTDLLDVICQRSLVEPTYQQIKDAGVILTDEQKGAILQYVQHGVNALRPFRVQPRDTKGADAIAEVQETPVRVAEDNR